ncbi:DNA repair protein RadC [Thermotomaculum hydrothermale]|uniref:DNA repair protein RadC n=1 Tax=Thermotomaculum hydrothermale TaxID=981385 RepID=A0A7R6SYU3_9BACT|nr:DNA repair protein RadC [Thermotomaculum hydrothermale]BBB33025.1 DNA repair protein RadC [Thermotomaculum hydrothermale]
MKPREKLIECGANKLKDEELLAILLRTGIKGKPVVQFSKEILKEFGGFSGLLDADIKDLIKVKGLNTSKATLLKALLEIVHRYFREKITLSEFKLQNPESVYKFLMSSIKWEDREKFSVLFVNNASNLIDCETLFMGNVNSIPLFISEILKKALRKGSRGIIVAHNHLTENIKPSNEDIRFTKRLLDACNIVEIELIDHIIYNPQGYFSFKSEGII